MTDSQDQSANSSKHSGNTANMKPPLSGPFKFGPYTVTSQAFYQSTSRQSFALVNLKPLLPGHVLICPTRSVPRFSQLSTAETTDLFLTVKRVSRVIERVYKASSLNIAIQDGPDAGQSVPHVHVHIVPRVKADLDARGGSDALYQMMEGKEGDLRGAFGKDGGTRVGEEIRSGWNGPDAEDERKPRSEEEMSREAQMLRQEMEREGAEID